MRKPTALLMSIVLVAAMTAAARGDMEGSAVAAVHATVTANISVTPSVPIVDAGSLQIGDLVGRIPFLVHANTEAVKMWVTATDLYKGDVPSEPTVDPIPLNTSAGATIDPAGATVFGGGSNVALLPASPDTMIGEFPAYQSQPIVFESMDNGTFSHDVLVIVIWTLTNNEQPMGDYGGRVMLSAMVMP
ncbi:MAG TPA: hypothetical protein VM238_10330 [Phycisphaerae bacterium]|nr:hypothetical protein [Phycisphaerae bacterium]